jgi:hypothetical protein
MLVVTKRNTGLIRSCAWGVALTKCCRHPSAVAGGYQQQLAARAAVRRGNAVASVFPFSRRDGPVSEVLFYDGGHDADHRILTLQVGCDIQKHCSTNVKRAVCMQHCGR